MTGVPGLTREIGCAEGFGGSSGHTLASPCRQGPLFSREGPTPCTWPGCVTGVTTDPLGELFAVGITREW